MKLIHSGPPQALKPSWRAFSARMIAVTHAEMAVDPVTDYQQVSELARSLGYVWASGAETPGPDDVVILFPGRENRLVEKVAVAVAQHQAAVVAVCDIGYLAGREDEILRFADVMSVLPRLDLLCTGRTVDPAIPVLGGARPRLSVVR